MDIIPRGYTRACQQNNWEGEAITIIIKSGRVGRVWGQQSVGWEASPMGDVWRKNSFVSSVSHAMICDDYTPVSPVKNTWGTRWLQAQRLNRPQSELDNQWISGGGTGACVAVQEREGKGRESVNPTRERISTYTRKMYITWDNFLYALLTESLINLSD